MSTHLECIMGYSVEKEIFCVISDKAGGHKMLHLNISEFARNILKYFSKRSKYTIIIHIMYHFMRY